MDKQPLISVIVPVYNAEDYLPACLDCLARQSWPKAEFILVDDGSTDLSGAICDEYAAGDSRFRVLHADNRGVAAARNAGLDAACGEWIGWVDSDDTVDPDFCEYLLSCALRYGADMSVCGMQSTVRGGAAPSWLPGEGCVQVLSREEAVEKYLRRRLHDGCVNKLVRRELWKDLRFPDYAMAEDLAVVWQLIERCEKVVLAPEEKYLYRRRDRSITTRKSCKARLDDYLAVKERFDGMVSRWPQWEELLGERCVDSAAGLWCGYLDFSAQEKALVKPLLKEISRFCRPYIPAAVRDGDRGPTGRLALRLTAWPHGWALFAAWLANWIYQRKHPWSL